MYKMLDSDEKVIESFLECQANYDGKELMSEGMTLWAGDTDIACWTQNQETGELELHATANLESPYSKYLKYLFYEIGRYGLKVKVSVT